MKTMPKVRLKFASQLRKLRSKGGITQEMMAERTGLDIRYYQRLESKKPSAIKIDTIDKIARAFGVTCSELMAF